MATLLAQTISSSTGLELGLATTMAVALLALGGWSAIIRHRQDDHGRSIKRLEKRVGELDDDKTRRDAVKAYRAGREPDAARPRPADSSSDL